MRKLIVSTLSLVGLAVGFLMYAAPTYAQATRTWVSGVGDDANPCSRTAPCKTFAGAISKTALNGEINCLDPAGYGSVTITKSITIDCTETYGSILSSGTTGIIISSFAGTDARKTVRLRNLTINGAETGTNGIRILGGAGTAGSVVYIDNVLINGIQNAPARGISDERTGGGKLFINNTVVRNVSQFGIMLSGASPVPTARLDAMLNNVRVENANFGILALSGSRASINNSVFQGNSTVGVHADGSALATEVHLSNSVVSNNGTGVTNAGGVITVVLSNNDITLNTTGISGTTFSPGNNRVVGNGSAGTAPTTGIGEQ